MTDEELRRKKPPYVIEKASGFYWQPKGKILLASPPCELGKDRVQAYLKGWELYYAAKADRAQPTAAKPFTISWAADKWQESDDFNLRTNGKPKAEATKRYYRTGLKVIEARIGRRDLRVFEKRHAKAWKKELDATDHPAMTACVMKTLRALFGYCIDEGWYKGKNPAAKMKLHIPRKGAYTAWGYDRVMAFYETCVREGRPKVGLAAVLVYDSAQNPLDILRLQWPRKNEGVVTLYAEDTPIYRDGVIDMARSKTGVGGIVPLSNFSVGLLEAIPEHERAGHVIVNEESGEPFTRRYFAALVAQMRAKAGLPASLKLGNLRHEALQEADDGGASAEAIQSLAQHAEPGTQRFYTQRRRATEAQAARERFRRKQRENAAKKL